MLSLFFIAYSVWCYVIMNYQALFAYLIFIIVIIIDSYVFSFSIAISHSFPFFCRLSFLLSASTSLFWDFLSSLFFSSFSSFLLLFFLPFFLTKYHINIMALYWFRWRKESLLCSVLNRMKTGNHDLFYFSIKILVFFMADCSFSFLI